MNVNAIPDSERAEMLAILHDSMQRYVRDRYDFQQRHARLAGGERWSRSAWSDYAEMGWLAMRMPPEHGGIAADQRTVGAAMEFVGSHLLMEPVLVSAVVATGLLLSLGTPAQCEAYLPRLASGAAIFAVALDEPANCEVRGGDRLYGEHLAVLHGDAATHALVRVHGGAPLYLVDLAAPGVQRSGYPLVDGRGAAHLRFDGAKAQALGAGGDAVQTMRAIGRARDEAAVALCAEALGVVSRLVEQTNAYLKLRQQFGKPIGSNQVLQHRMVELYILQREIRALNAAAQDALDRDAPDRERLASAAKAYVGRAARHVANEAVQMHGGVGVTDELEVSHGLRRLMVVAALFGDRDEHFLRFQALTSGSVA